MKLIENRNLTIYDDGFQRKCKEAIISQFGTAIEFMTKFSPKKQIYVSKNPDKVYSGTNAPSLIRAVYAYGYEVIANMLVTHLAEIIKAERDDKKMPPDELLRISYDILNDPQFRTLRITEFMLFITQYRTGMFGEVYGSVTSFSICSALRKFMKKREFELSKIKKEECTDTSETITLEEYCRRTGKSKKEIFPFL